MAPHAVLREIAVPFELVRIDTAAGAHRTAAYRAINPNQRVPTLVHGDRVMSESAAIVLYLCELHPEAGLMPLPGEPRRHLFLQWLTYFTNTMQEELHHWWHAEYYCDGDASQADLKTVADRRLGEIFSRLDSTLAAAGPYILGERFSAADIYFAMLCRWTRKMTVPATAYPAINRLIGLVTARPAWSAMMEAEGIDWNGTLT